MRRRRPLFLAAALAMVGGLLRKFYDNQLDVSIAALVDGVACAAEILAQRTDESTN